MPSWGAGCVVGGQVRWCEARPILVDHFGTANLLGDDWWLLWGQVDDLVNSQLGRCDQIDGVHDVKMSVYHCRQLPMLSALLQGHWTTVCVRLNWFICECMMLKCQFTVAGSCRCWALCYKAELSLLSLRSVHAITFSCTLMSSVLSTCSSRSSSSRSIPQRLRAFYTPTSTCCLYVTGWCLPST